MLKVVDVKHVIHYLILLTITFDLTVAARMIGAVLQTLIAIDHYHIITQYLGGD
jgi:hypothetical protein